MNSRNKGGGKMAGDTKAIVAQFLQAWQRERDHKIKICLFGQP